ncbi:MFS general substrate transporter [Schizophyllum commune Tattone D]|nr:MFS general substrate transporter [Schizophyllum commune Tattone D]
MTSMDDPEKTFSVKDSEVQLQSTTGATPSVQSDETVHAPNVEEEFPEGGLEAWLTVLGAFLVQVCGFGYTMSFGVFQDYYVRVYLPNVSTSAISWIGSVASFLVMACGLPAGRIYDHGYFRYQLWGGFFLISFALFMLSLAKEGQFYQIFLAQGVAVGLGVGMLYVPSMAALSHYFRRRQSLAMSIAASGSSLGAIIHTIMLNNTLDKLGFARATRAHAGLVSLLLLCAVGLMRTRLPPAKTRPNLLRAVRRFAKDVPYVCAAVGCSMFIVGMYYPLFYLQLDATQHGINKKVAFYVVSPIADRSPSIPEYIHSSWS